jgi:hypothetical protein
MGSRRAAATGGARTGRIGSRPRPARHTGLPLRSRPGAGRTASPRAQPERRQHRRAQDYRVTPRATLTGCGRRSSLKAPGRGSRTGSQANNLYIAFGEDSHFDALVKDKLLNRDVRFS